MPRKWVDTLLILVISGAIAYLISSYFSKQTRDRLKFYVDGKVAAR